MTLQNVGVQYKGTYLNRSSRAKACLDITPGFPTGDVNENSLCHKSKLGMAIENFSSNPPQKEKENQGCRIGSVLLNRYIQEMQNDKLASVDNKVCEDKYTMESEASSTDGSKSSSSEDDVVNQCDDSRNGELTEPGSVPYNCKANKLNEQRHSITNEIERGLKKVEQIQQKLLEASSIKKTSVSKQEAGLKDRQKSKVMMDYVTKFERNSMSLDNGDVNCRRKSSRIDTVHSNVRLCSTLPRKWKPPTNGYVIETTGTITSTVSSIEKESETEKKRNKKNSAPNCVGYSKIDDMITPKVGTEGVNLCNGKHDTSPNVVESSDAVKSNAEQRSTGNESNTNCTSELEGSTFSASLKMKRNSTPSLSKLNKLYSSTDETFGSFTRKNDEDSSNSEFTFRFKGISRSNSLSTIQPVVSRQFKEISFTMKKLSLPDISNLTIDDGDQIMQLDIDTKISKLSSRSEVQSSTSCSKNYNGHVETGLNDLNPCDADPRSNGARNLKKPEKKTNSKEEANDLDIFDESNAPFMLSLSINSAQSCQDRRRKTWDQRSPTKNEKTPRKVSRNRLSDRHSMPKRNRDFRVPIRKRPFSTGSMDRIQEESDEETDYIRKERGPSLPGRRISKILEEGEGRDRRFNNVTKYNNPIVEPYTCHGSENSESPEDFPFSKSNSTESITLNESPILSCITNTFENDLVLRMQKDVLEEIKEMGKIANHNFEATDNIDNSTSLSPPYRKCSSASPTVCRRNSYDEETNLDSKQKFKDSPNMVRKISTPLSLDGSENGALSTQVYIKRGNCVSDKTVSQRHRKTSVLGISSEAMSDINTKEAHRKYSLPESMVKNKRIVHDKTFERRQTFRKIASVDDRAMPKNDRIFEDHNELDRKRSLQHRMPPSENDRISKLHSDTKSDIKHVDSFSSQRNNRAKAFRERKWQSLDIDDRKERKTSITDALRSVVGTRSKNEKVSTLVRTLSSSSTDEHGRDKKSKWHLIKDKIKKDRPISMEMHSPKRGHRSSLFRYDSNSSLEAESVKGKKYFSKSDGRPAWQFRSVDTYETSGDSYTTSETASYDMDKLVPPPTFNMWAESKVDIDLENTSLPLLHVAAGEGNLKILHSLDDIGVDMNETDPNGWSALHYAVCSGQFEAASFLIEKGINLRTYTNKVMNNYCATVRECIRTSESNNQRYRS